MEMCLTGLNPLTLKLKSEYSYRAEICVHNTDSGCVGCEHLGLLLVSRKPRGAAEPRSGSAVGAPWAE